MKFKKEDFLGILIKKIDNFYFECKEISKYYDKDKKIMIKIIDKETDLNLFNNLKMFSFFKIRNFQSKKKTIFHKSKIIINIHDFANLGFGLNKARYVNFDFEKIHYLKQHFFNCNASNIFFVVDKFFLFKDNIAALNFQTGKKNFQSLFLTEKIKIALNDNGNNFNYNACPNNANNDILEAENILQAKDQKEVENCFKCKSLDQTDQDAKQKLLFIYIIKDERWNNFKYFLSEDNYIKVRDKIYIENIKEKKPQKHCINKIFLNPRGKINLIKEKNLKKNTIYLHNKIILRSFLIKQFGNKGFSYCYIKNCFYKDSQKLELIRNLIVKEKFKNLKYSKVDNGFNLIKKSYLNSEVLNKDFLEMILNTLGNQKEIKVFQSFENKSFLLKGRIIPLSQDLNFEEVFFAKNFYLKKTSSFEEFKKNPNFFNYVFFKFRLKLASFGNVCDITFTNENGALNSFIKNLPSFQDIKNWAKIDLNDNLVQDFSEFLRKFIEFFSNQEILVPVYLKLLDGLYEFYVLDFVVY